jgi:ATP/maltotriose-dependent transcriptional regulator MalT
MRLIQGKISQPPRPQQSTSRPRVVELLVTPLQGGRNVTVTATAGSGKTTAVAEAVHELAAPVAWLALDSADRAPGRLLTYLQAAIRRAMPLAPDVVTEALASGLPQVETAGLLAESLDDDLVVVIDDLERIATSPSACDALAAFIRYAPRSAQVVLVGRLDIALPDDRTDPTGRARIGDRDLAFRPDEARKVLAALGRDDIDAEQAVEATGGWITGIRFEMWRYAEHVHGAGGEADPLRGYLSVEIMSALTRPQRELLIATSVLDEVTPARAEALGLRHSGQTLDSLSKRHLPVEFAPTGLAMRCHPRFREYLQDQLEHADPGWVRSVRRAHGNLLCAERRYEEAVDELLRAGDPASAAVAAEDAAPGVLDRLDFDVVADWLEALGPSAVNISPQLIAAEIRVACEREEYAHGAHYADRLLSAVPAPPGELLTPGLVTTIAWCYFLVSRIEDAQALLRSAADSPDRRLMQFIIGLELADDPTHYADRPPDCGGPADGLLARADLAHGRFQLVLASQSRPWAAISSSRIGATAALGNADQALALLGADRPQNWTSVRMRAELMVDLGNPEEAWTALIQGRDLLTRSGSNLYRMFALLLEASLALRYRRDTAFAAAALKEVEREPSALRRIRIIEQLHLWRGLAALIDDDAVAAAEQLRQAVAVMTRWDRLLYLPTAAVYLAEAEWRLDDVDAADRAADIALEAARRQGSQHLLIQALRDFPAVVSRRLDAETTADSAWHDLGRAVLTPDPVAHPSPHAQVHITEFGEHRLTVNGVEVQPKLAKSLELLSYLACHGGRVTRVDVLQALFDGRSDESASAYFRMALNGLRKVLPADAPLTSQSGVLAWAGDGLSSESVQAESAALRLAHVPKQHWARVTAEVLASLDRGEFLPACRADWAVERRRRLEVLGVDTRELAAEAAYGTGEYRRADDLAWQVLKIDPYRERSWRLAMKIAAALGHEDRILLAYRACAEALAEIGTKPAAATQALLASLRGIPAREAM